MYILHSHIVAYVPNATVKDVLMQNDPEGRRGKWIVAILEYELEIKPTKMVKGKYLVKLMAESNLHVLDINLIVALLEEEVVDSSAQVSHIFTSSSWYSDIVYVLQHFNSPPGVSKRKASVMSFHDCQIFQGKRKLLPLPLQPISVQAPFQ